MKYAVSGLLSLVLLPSSLQCFAQAATLSDCQGIQDRLARYACYDKWDSASGVVRQSVPTARAEEDDDTSLFGRVFDRDSDETEEAAPPLANEAAPTTIGNFGRSDARLVAGDEGAELVDTIAALQQRAPNLWLVTLSSGQQWEQNVSKRYPLVLGDEVRVYPTRWGNSYRMTAERAGGFIQVRRVDDGGAVAMSPSRASIELAPRVEQDEDEPGLLGRMGSRIGGIFSRDDAGDEAAQAVTEEAADTAPEAESVVDFGRSGSDARVVEGDDGAELIDTVASLDQAGPNLWLVTLESGQRWRQMISKRYPLEVGDAVRIYPTRWGSSFRLSVEKNGSYIQVERVD